MRSGSDGVVLPGDPGRGGNEDGRKSDFAIWRSGAKAVLADRPDRSANCGRDKTCFGIEEADPLELASQVSR
jgi:hypothetical protein